MLLHCLYQGRWANVDQPCVAGHPRASLLCAVTSCCYMCLPICDGAGTLLSSHAIVGERVTGLISAVCNEKCNFLLIK